MGRQKTELVSEVFGLVAKGSTEEAIQKVFGHLEQALSRLDQESRNLLEEFFEGASISKLSKSRALSYNETQDWIKRAKQQVIHELKKGTRVRH